MATRTIISVLSYAKPALDFYVQNAAYSIVMFNRLPLHVHNDLASKFPSMFAIKWRRRFVTYNRDRVLKSEKLDDWLQVFTQTAAVTATCIETYNFSFEQICVAVEEDISSVHRMFPKDHKHTGKRIWGGGGAGEWFQRKLPDSRVQIFRLFADFSKNCQSEFGIIWQKFAQRFQIQMILGSSWLPLLPPPLALYACANDSDVMKGWSQKLMLWKGESKTDVFLLQICRRPAVVWYMLFDTNKFTT